MNYNYNMIIILRSKLLHKTHILHPKSNFRHFKDYSTSTNGLKNESHYNLNYLIYILAIHNLVKTRDGIAYQTHHRI